MMSIPKDEIAFGVFLSLAMCVGYFMYLTKRHQNQTIRDHIRWVGQELDYFKGIWTEFQKQTLWVSASDSPNAQALAELNAVASLLVEDYLTMRALFRTNPKQASIYWDDFGGPASVTDFGLRKETIVAEFERFRKDVRPDNNQELFVKAPFLVQQPRIPLSTLLAQVNQNANVQNPRIGRVHN